MCPGITKQREKITAWDTITGSSYYNTIAWDDIRTAETATFIAVGEIDRLRSKTGLPIASYFSGMKVRWKNWRR